MYIIQCTVHNAQCTVPSIQCTQSKKVFKPLNSKFLKIENPLRNSKFEINSKF